MDEAVFGAGCFWGVQASFDQLKGVVGTEVGYSGGHTRDPTYKDVCTDRTGHAEVVKVRFDPSVISYRQLLDHFFSIHDPTTINRQGPDTGRQYRSVILYRSGEQEKEAREASDRWERSGTYQMPIVTEISPLGEFYKAEEYHQKYFERTELCPHR
ncbi:MAG: peptide-methionine (S)-S-oxide reductase MsrA [Candidatus Thermoplasmatota archaeon]|nr:peptide-methionine (S)-S-oxide reductase MsrA [Candidatus Thermoplasmatota archaeon]